ncbi:unnamed protein product [Paramecium pentaurelia]|uniref:Uncharacterized protein n=1 Tax=Paramecium pentaurelia TaxID=43138 RepID=A0A8S1Y6Q8_9CILI|nr:unnamed protein product [Paramecium pentaurelia]
MKYSLFDAKQMKKLGLLCDIEKSKRKKQQKNFSIQFRRKSLKGYCFKYQIVKLWVGNVLKSKS